jgi:hypothetical protein
MLPIPHALTKAYLKLEKFDPESVALAFFNAMKEFDASEADELSNETIPNLEEEDKITDEVAEVDMEEKTGSINQDTEVVIKKTMLSEFLHIMQFCHLCFKKKMPPVSYSVATTPAIETWFKSVSIAVLHSDSNRSKRQASCDSDHSDSEDEVSSPDQKLSKKDHYFLSTMMKINDAMDKNYKDKSDKEPGFNRLEEHRKNLILNASAIPPFDEKATKPTEFLTAFLAKKSQFKAKDMLVHRLQSEKICFNPGSCFINNLWNCDFFWLLPDSPSGISIFFCPETKSANASDLEKDRLLALADKVNLSDIEKLAKQKLFIPNTLMDMVWMTQNLYTIIKLCFGQKSHSATFLKDWADHMYENRNMYMTQHTADPFFFAKVLFAIDKALQSHWRSCSMSDDRLSVNDSVLQMQEVQESILDLSFSRQIPKSISDKINNYLDKNSDKDDKGQGKNGKHNGGNNKNGANGNGRNGTQKDQEVVYNTDKSKPHWKLQEGENFSKVFYHKQKECPKTVDGKLICMKYFMRGMCGKTCNCAHSLSQDDSKKFDKLLADCREEAAKKDF